MGANSILITPECWRGDFEMVSFRDEVKSIILNQSVMRLLGLNYAPFGVICWIQEHYCHEWPI
jgi:hypothetical protein